MSAHRLQHQRQHALHAALRRLRRTARSAGWRPSPVLTRAGHVLSL